MSLNVALLRLDQESQNKLFQRVVRNITMNEHIYNQQRQILKLVMQHTELFYSASDNLFLSVWSFLYRHFENLEDELRIDAVSTLTAF